MKNNELNDKLNLDTIARRVKAPTPTFWKKVQIIGAALAFACGTILAAPIALPVALHTILVVGTTVGTVAAGLGQVTKEDQPVEEKKQNDEQ